MYARWRGDLRNNSNVFPGGGHWNHGIYTKNVDTPNTTNTSTSSMSGQLDAAIRKSFGDVDALRYELSRAAMGRRAAAAFQS